MLSYIFSGVEIALIIAIIGTAVTLGLRESGTQRREHMLKQIQRRIPGRLAEAVVIELETFLEFFRYFVRKGWKLEEPKKDEFSFMSESSYPYLLTGMILIILADGPILHFFVIPAVFAPSNQAVAHFVAIVLNLYALVWILGDYFALRRSYHRLTDEGIEFGFGLRASFKIEKENIEAIEPLDQESCRNQCTKKSRMRLSTSDSPNVCVRLKESRILGQRFLPARAVKCVHLFLDSPGGFLDQSTTTYAMPDAPNKKGEGLWPSPLP